MLALWLLAVAVLFPAVAVAQTSTPQTPGQPTTPGQVIPPGQPVVPGPIVPKSPAEAQIIVNPRTPPPPTISSAPEVVIPIPPPDTTRPVRLFEFRPTLTLSEEYSDNFNQTPDNRISNYRTGISPGLLLLVRHPFLNGQAAYTPLAFYDSSDDRADVNHAFAGSLTWDVVPRFQLTVSDSFNNSDQAGAADRLNLRRGRERFTTNGASITGTYTFEPFLAQAYYRNTYFTSDRDTTTTHAPGASISMALAQINTVTLGYEYLDTKTTVDDPSTTNSSTFFGGPTEDSRTTGHQVTATYSREISRVLTAGLTGTYATREQETTTRMNFTRESIALFSNYVLPERLIIRSSLGVARVEGDTASGRPLVTTDSSLTYYRGPATLSLRVEQGFSETFGTGENFGVVETKGFTASFGYRFTPLLSALVSGTYRENKSTGEGGGQTTSGQDEKSVSATANLTYQIFRWLAATLDYTYTHTNSADASGSYTENRIRAALSASFY